MKQKNTAWEKQGKWYNQLVGPKGHYFHEHVVLPGMKAMMHLKKDSKILDIGCGQGIFGKTLAPDIAYTGLDLSRSLIEAAKKTDPNPKHTYILGDATKPFPIKEKDFTHAVAILSLQNIEQVDETIAHVANHLIPNGQFVFVINHPSFRIPKQSGWGIREENKIQYRYVNAYMSSLKIPITMHPGDRPDEHTWSFHHPLSFYTRVLKENGFVIENIEEWVSDKVSVGPAGKMENRARNEIPLFMAISATKVIHNS